MLQNADLGYQELVHARDIIYMYVYIYIYIYMYTYISHIYIYIYIHMTRPTPFRYALVHGWTAGLAPSTLRGPVVSSTRAHGFVHTSYREPFG